MARPNQRTLHLTLQKKWFDMIASGEKREEYREIKQYWQKRLVKPSSENYDVLLFRNGYNKTSRKILVELDEIVVGFGRNEWGASARCDQLVFILRLGRVLIGTKQHG